MGKVGELGEELDMDLIQVHEAICDQVHVRERPRDALAENGRQDHPLLRYLSPDKQEMSHTPSPAAPFKGRAQLFFDCDSDMETAVAMTLFNTPSQAN